MEFDAEWLPYRLDPVLRRVLWVRMPAAARAAAAFLDERALHADIEGAWAPLHSLGVMPAPPHAADALFHIGHCGSTLLSRVLEAWTGVQALRKPLPLRVLAGMWTTRGQACARIDDATLDRLLQGAWHAWSRQLAPGTRVVVKATSGCAGLAAPLLAAHASMRVVMLDMPLAAWLATLMKSPGSMADALESAPERLADLAARGLADGLVLHALSPPRQLAMCWLAEQARSAALAAAHPTRVLRVDFHDLLDAPRAQLARIAAHLDLAPDGVDAALRAPAWGRYAKAESHTYDARDRAHDLAVSRRQSAEVIDDAIDWAHRHVVRHPALAPAGARLLG